MNSIDINNLTPEQVAQIKENGGFAGSIKTGFDFQPEVRTPQASIPIGRKETVSLISGQEKITGSSDRLQQRWAEQKAKELAAQEEERQAFKAKRDSLSPESLRKDISYLKRAVSRIEKMLKEND